MDLEQCTFTQGETARASLRSLASSDYAQLTRKVCHDTLQSVSKRSIGCTDESLMEIEGIL